MAAYLQGPVLSPMLCYSLGAATETISSPAVAGTAASCPYVWTKHISLSLLTFFFLSVAHFVPQLLPVPAEVCQFFAP